MGRKPITVNEIMKTIDLLFATGINDPDGTLYHLQDIAKHARGYADILETHIILEEPSAVIADLLRLML